MCSTRVIPKTVPESVLWRNLKIIRKFGLFKFFKDFNGFTPPYSILAHSVVGRWQNYKFMSSTFWHFLQKAIHKFYPSYFTPILGFNNRRCWSPTVFSGWGLTPPPFFVILDLFGHYWKKVKNQISQNIKI